MKESREYVVSRRIDGQMWNVIPINILVADADADTLRRR
jgi:hypothetical protein